MGFIDLFFKNKKEIKEIDVKQFISQKIEESSNLDYKDIQSYQNIEDLSIHISSFANSEGGLIILGISQDEIKDENGNIVKIFPKNITWGAISFDKETIENKLLAKIKPPINNLIIKPVRNEKNEVIFLIDIPKSPDAPHMAHDHRYYQRGNFRKRFLEHFEVANLFKNNWTMKEKLVEKIYEPLSSTLGDHIEQLKNFKYVSTNEITDILKNTYYKKQIPKKILDLLNNYIVQCKEFIKQENQVRKKLENIFRIRVIEYLKKFFPTSSDWNLFGEPKIEAIPEKGAKTIIYNQAIFSLLMNNQTIQYLLEKDYWYYVYKKISITYITETRTVDFVEFNENLWNNCLKDVLNHSKIIRFKESTKILLGIAEEILGKITE